MKHKAVYRGVNPKLSLQVKSIATDLLLPTGEVARALIEYALERFERGELEIEPHSIPSNTLWRVITTWRNFPPSLKGELTLLASRDGLDMPIGELINNLLIFGLQAYKRGLMTIGPFTIEKFQVENREAG